MPRSIATLALLAWSANAAAQTLTFGHHAPAVGDAVQQSVRVEMRLESTARQGAEVIESTTSAIDREQTRRVTATEVTGKRVVGAEVRFFNATAARDGAAEQQPIAGKAYLCRRESDERLTITTPDGQLPPMNEYELVTRAMESLGTASPLAEYLAGRTVRVGERLELPAELAQRALGFDSRMGEVDRFVLKLTRVEDVESRRVGRFEAEIEAHGASSQQMRLIVAGAFQIDGATCRIVSADLSGPIAMSGARGGKVGAYTLDGKGKMRLALKAQYRDARR
ncbi:hypothetical protein MalM25_01570 [Planctomycetes bacterium MalM25]|nr:hypothetical protein MalM25_01570 [Planctomycetes bacterium MalM25]